MAGKKPAPAKFEEAEDESDWEDGVVDAEGKDGEVVDLRLRDWRDVERYREMKELKNLVDDDSGLAEIFHVPKPRPAPPPARAAAKLPAGKSAKVPPPGKATPSNKEPPPKVVTAAKPAAKVKAAPAPVAKKKPPVKAKRRR